MARRLQALILLFAFGLLLPVAGAPRRFCLKMQSFISHECCDPHSNCGDCPEDEKSPTAPSCVAVAKVMPDSLSPDPVTVPELVFTAWEPVLPPILEIAADHAELTIFPERAPPDSGPRKFLRLRSLLI